MSDAVFARTDNRSVLGTMNDYEFMAKEMKARGNAPESLEGAHAVPRGNAHHRARGVRPVDLVREAFGG